MTERPDNTRLHDWLHETVGETPDPVEGTQQVMSQVEETSQVGRWLPFPVFHRKARAKTSTATDTAEYQPSPIPAANGHTPTVIGRTQSMLSPAKAITAGALVFALGGVLLIAQPFDQQSAVPGAETEAIAPIWVTGTVTFAPSCSGPDSEMVGDVRRDWSNECSPQTWTATDPRLTGEVAFRWNSDIYQTDAGTVEVNTSASYLRNDDGGWVCSSSPLWKGSGPSTTEAVTGDNAKCVGEGGYEGLSALLAREKGPGPGYSAEFVGLIFSGDFPPLPEAPAAE